MMRWAGFRRAEFPQLGFYTPGGWDANPIQDVIDGKRGVREVLTEIDTSQVTTVVRVSARDEQRARAIIARYTDKDFSLTDATSFAVMERLGISEAFTLDQNFAQYGWTMLGI